MIYLSYSLIYTFNSPQRIFLSFRTSVILPGVAQTNGTINNKQRITPYLTPNHSSTQTSLSILRFLQVIYLQVNIHINNYHDLSLPHPPYTHFPLKRVFYFLKGGGGLSDRRVLYYPSTNASHRRPPPVTSPPLKVQYSSWMLIV